MSIRMTTAASVIALLVGGSAMAMHHEGDKSALKENSEAVTEAKSKLGVSEAEMRAKGDMAAEGEMTQAEPGIRLSLVSYIGADISNAQGDDVGDVHDVEISDDWKVASIKISDDTVLDLADKTAFVEPDALTITAGEKGKASFTVATTISDLIPQGDTDPAADKSMSAYHSAKEVLIDAPVFDAEGNSIATVSDAILTGDGKIEALVLSDSTNAAPFGRLVKVEASKFSLKGKEPGVVADLSEAELDAMSTFNYETDL